MKKRHKRLQLESLEAKRVLTTYTVDTLEDVVNAGDGVTSLREAILLANQDTAADVIEFAPSAIGTIFLEDSLTLGDLEISQPLTIRGNGRASTIVDGNASAEFLEARRVFNVLPSAGDVTFEDMTIQNGQLSTFSGPQTGAGINFLSTGRLTVRNSNIAGNLISGSAGGSGGGIHAVGDVWIEGSNITNNYVYSRSQGNVRGGGIDAAGQLVVLNTSVAGNEAYDTATRFRLAASSGGGIFGGEVWVFNSTVSGNRAAVEGGGILAETAKVYSSTVTENTAATGSGVLARNAASFFGSIIAANQFEDFRTRANVITSNYTLFGNGGRVFGGSLPAAPTPDANGNLIGTSATPIDSALLPLAQNGSPTATHAFTGNSPALHAVRGVLTGLPANNFSSAEEAHILNALHFDQRGIPRTTIPSLGFFGDMGAHEAEASYEVNTDEDYPLPDNDDTQTSLREAIGFANATAQVNSIIFDMDAIGSPAVIKLQHGELQIKEDLTLHGPGAELLEIEGARSRVFFIDEGDDVDLMDVKLKGITISGGQSINDGGNILSHASLTIENAVISKGLADRGAGIFATGPTTIRDSSIVENHGNNAGGGIYATANLTVERSHFTDNSSVDGGGIAVSDTNVAVVDSTFTGNASSDNGGGLLGEGSNITILRSTFVENESTGGDGGGIFVGGGSLTVTNSTISGNTADEDGGGLAVESVTAQVRNSTLTLNTAKRFGGVAGPVDLQSTIVANNVASIEPDVGEFAHGSHNLIGIINNPDDLVHGENNNQVGTTAAPIDPLLGPLGNHGGVTQVHPLLEMSPALNAGSNPSALTTDQRGDGFIRESGTADIGAFESFNVPPIIHPFPTSSLPNANFFINEGELFQYQVMASDPDSELIYSVTDQDGLFGPISIDPTTGLLSWTPNELAGPRLETFKVSVTEKDEPNRTESAVIFFFVEEVNTPAVIDPIPDQFVAANTTLNLQVTAADSDVPLFHSYTIASAAEGPFPTGAMITPSGAFSFTPTMAQEGQTFYVKLELVDFNRVTSTVFKITTGVPNTAPQVSGGQQTTNEDVALDVDLRAFASDAETTDDNLTYNVSGAVGGSVQLLPDGHTARFTPTLNTHTTPASFQFSTTDEQGASSGLATIQVSVTPINDKPFAGPETINTQEEIPVTLDLRTLVSDVETPAWAFDTFRVFSPVNGSVILIDDHTAQFTPNLDIHSPQQSFSFQYTATDPGDSSSPSLTSDPATVTVLVEAINDVPVANDTTISTDEGTPVDINLRTIVFDKETILDELTFTVGDGVAGLNDPVNGTVALLADGYTARFTPAAGLYSPDSSFSFQYRARDTGANLAPPVDSPAGTVTVTVNRDLDPAPMITDTLIGGSSWEVSFYSLLNGENLDSPLPWTNLNTVEIQFDRPIVAPSANAITLTGINSETYVPTGVDPVSDTVVRWTFNSLPTDTYELTVHADQILNVDNVPLNDGNNVVQAFDIVRGDANRGGGTTVTDVVVVGSQHGQASSQAFAYDLNGNGEVSVTDVILAGRYVGHEKPSGDPPELLRIHRQGPGTTVSVSEDQLRSTFEAAVDILVARGLPTAEAGVLREDVSISFASLPGGQLGTASGLSIELDASAGGWGWFVDATPKDSTEFRRVPRTRNLIARNPDHREQVDLLTVVLHELGHLFGEDHVDHDHPPTHWMSEELVPGIRRLPTAISDDSDEHHAESPNNTADPQPRPTGRRLRRVRQTFS